MLFLERPQVRRVVIESLQSVANLPEDPEAITFDNFQPFHKVTFLNNLKKGINSIPFLDETGQRSEQAFYDIDLRENSTDDWENAGACIDWVVENQKVVFSKIPQ